jgi:hypothetical protein
MKRNRPASTYIPAQELFSPATLDYESSVGHSCDSPFGLLICQAFANSASQFSIESITCQNFTLSGTPSKDETKLTYSESSSRQRLTARQGDKDSGFSRG